MSNESQSPATSGENKTEGQAAAEPVKAKPAGVTAAPKKSGSGKKIAVLVVLLVGIGLVVKYVLGSMGTVETDDAYVNSHVTFVAPRVPGQVAKVLVDDNNRVRKGDVLVELDPATYQVEVDLKTAALELAKADVVAATAGARSQVALTRSARFKLQHAIESVHNQIAVLRANVAALNNVKASLDLAQSEFDRAKKLNAGKVTSSEEFEQKQAALSVAQARVAEAEENVARSRVALGLDAKPENGDLTDVPPKIDQTFSSVREAQAEVIQNAAQLNVTISSYDLTPEAMVKEFLDRDPQGDINRIYEQLVKDAPGVKQAEARLKSAESDLAQAKLNLSYCKIVAEIDGVVTRRNVNAGNNVQVGQSLMAVRSLTEVWVDANFKETQIAKLKIGQPVDLETDVYGTKKTFKGRISGFTMGTGSTLALLPAQNASGNFVKVVQRLPVKIDLIDYDPDKDPLFVGISVTPKVHTGEEASGPNAGMLLQPYSAAPDAKAPAAETPASAKQ